MEVTTKIKLKPYLREFLIAKFGEEPIRFPENSDLLALIHVLRIKPPKRDIVQDDASVILQDCPAENALLAGRSCIKQFSIMNRPPLKSTMIQTKLRICRKKYRLRKAECPHGRENRSAEK